MEREQSQDIRIERVENLRTPLELSRALPLSELDKEKIKSYRKSVNDIIMGRDERLLAIVGPCSIHDPKAALDYAQKLKELSLKVEDKFFIVMRTYFEKPRTALGWKGLVMDPYMNGTLDIDKGLELCRKLLLDITSLGLPVGCECLDPIIPQYTDSLMSWSSIGARTSESQTHRSLASGLSVAVGFKNATSGDLTSAVNAVKSARSKAAFIGITRDGKIAEYRTNGNEMAHIILRGGAEGPNYYEDDVEKAEMMMRDNGLEPRIVIDCSHANSGKDENRQKRVLRSIIDQKIWGNKSIKGFMLESNLFGGNQSVPDDLSKLKYGISVTDKCLGWDETERILLHAAELLRRGEEEIL